MSGQNRRDFLQTSALVGAGFWAAGGLTPGESRAAADKLRFACIGVGGKGSSDTDDAGTQGEIVALCDVDENTLGGKAKKYPQAKTFTDYRKMLDEMGKQIDAVTVSTADHTHAHASILAMRMGKHVYTQKPLCHSVYEARLMREEATKNKVCTQMGNQGTATNGLRQAVEIIQAGVLGAVKEVHVWTNRPIWPQGADAILRVPAAREAALAALHGKVAAEHKSEPPRHLNWDCFLGPAQYRPYAPIYHPFSWRGWWDFGTGAIGDMACHTANMVYMALKLGLPTSVVCEEVEGLNPETAPTGARVALMFPEREGLAPVKFTWYEGIDNNRNKFLPKKELFHGQSPPGSGSMMVGEKGILYSPNDYGADFMFLGKNASELKEAAKQVKKTLPRNANQKNIDNGMKQEWVEAIRNNKPSIALSNFDYASMLTEAILLGNVAMRAGKGNKLEYDAATGKIKNVESANQFIKRDYRKGWEL
jgi:predicted dehydrogenase